jgi:hypothetical protein
MIEMFSKKCLGVIPIVMVFCWVQFFVSSDLPMNLTGTEPWKVSKATQDTICTSITKPLKAICFITCAYSNSTQMVDKIGVPTLGYHPGFRFFLFTNLPALKPPGWTQIVTGFNFSTHIVESRYPKFLGWKFPEIQDACRVAIYHDGNSMTSDLPDAFMNVADLVLEKTSNENPGWMQYNSTRRGPLDELKAILRYRKDTLEHVQQTTEWLHSIVPLDVRNQTEWLAALTVYANSVFAYDPTSLNFHRITEDFWSVYSANMTTWRDQPIWAYFVHKHGQTPLEFPERPGFYVQKRLNATGFNGHTYT